MPADLSIQNAFLDGIEEIFRIMFTDRVMFYYLDPDFNKPNIYDEVPKKRYRDPIQLIGRVQLSIEKSEEAEKTVSTNVTITIPTKQMISHKIPRLTEKDFEILRRSKFSYNGEDYLVSVVKPKTQVADEWQFYEFKCYRDEESSLVCEVQ